jgi:RNA polymerase-binding transcription factor DksA
MASETLLESVREQLTAERVRLAEQLARLGLDADNLDENFADSGQVTAERGELEALTGSLLETLQEIDDALAKLADGRYGLCEECGQPIGEARLEAMPAARLCITCASKRR